MENKLTVKEVAQIMQEEESTIRYWEKEFQEFLNIKVNKGVRKRYTSQNLEMFIKISELLHREMYTIKGAKRRLELDRTVGDSIGVEHNFKTTVLFMFSCILNELQQSRSEALALSEKVQELQHTKSIMEKELIEAQNKGIFKLFRPKIQTKG